MNLQIYNLFAGNKKLPKGTRIVGTDGVTRELTEDQLKSANKVPNAFSNYVPLWVIGWNDLLDALLPPE